MLFFQSSCCGIDFNPATLRQTYRVAIAPANELLLVATFKEFKPKLITW